MPFVKVNDIQIYYEVQGEGFPLIMINGLGAHIDSWDPRFIQNLSKEFKLVLFDNRGSGNTDVSEREYTMRLFADDTSGLMSARARGILEMKKIASLCEAFGNQFIPHCWDPGLGVAANLQVIGTLLEEVCPYMEFPYDPPWTPEVRDCMLEEPIVAKNGFVGIPDKPGLGVEVNAEALEKYVA